MRSTRTGVAAALSLLVLLAGCGGDDSGKADDDGGSDKSSESSSDPGFADQSAEDIADAAKADMKELEAVHYSGSISSGGNDIELDVQASTAGDCQGTVQLGEGSAEVASKDGDSWFRPDEAFWQQQVPDQADEIISQVGDKWVVDDQNQFTQFCDLDEFFEGILTSDDTDATYEVDGTDELDGQDVVKVTNTKEDGASTAYVLVDEPHYLLKIEKTEGEDLGTVEFSEFDEEFDVDAPTEDEIFDISQLG